MGGNTSSRQISFSGAGGGGRGVIGQIISSSTGLLILSSSEASVVMGIFVPLSGGVGNILVRQ